MMPPRVVPQQWSVGINADKKDGEGDLEVRMTFAMTDEHKQAIKDWMNWLMSIDPAWGGAP